MKIIKTGYYKKENTITCDECNCIFQYFNTDVIFETSDPYEEELFGGYHICSYVKCPTCNNKIILKQDFIEQEDIFTSFGKWISNKLHNKRKDDKMEKKTIVFDFDGVIHRYSEGWKDGTIYDEPVNGIKEVIDKLMETYNIIIVSTRSATRKGKNDILKWLKKYDINVTDVMASKPPAIIYVDDRAINFDGNCDKLLKNIEHFNSWIDRSKKICAYCGKEFTISGPFKNRQKYCSKKCRIEANLK